MTKCFPKELKANRYQTSLHCESIYQDKNNVPRE